MQTNDKTIFSFSLLASFSAKMYETLLYLHNLNTATPKVIEWKDNFLPVHGYILIKGNQRYVLNQYDEDSDEDNVNKLPIRVNNYAELDSKSNDVVCYITEYSSFKVKPELIYNFKEIIHMDNIIHSNESAWTLYKIISHACRYGRINLRIAANKNWGKTSYFQMLDYLLNKCYVITNPQSFAGMSLGITDDGVLILDEISGDIPSEDKRSIAKFLYQLGDLRNKIKSGTAGSLSYNTKPMYDVTNLSCVILYNPIGYYNDKNKYFDFMFTNSPAINDRFLPLYLSDGELPIDQFSKSKHLKLTEDHERLFKDYMKSCEWVKQNWKTIVDMDYIYDRLKTKDIKGRHRDSYVEILCFIYLYSKYSDNLDDTYYLISEELWEWYKNYEKMIKTTDLFESINVEEEMIK